MFNPKLSPEVLSSTGAYELAYSVAAICFAVGLLLWRASPSRWLRSEGRELFKGSLISLGILLSVLSAGMLYALLVGRLGLPEWDIVTAKADALAELGESLYSSLIGFTVAMAAFSALLYALAKLTIVGLFVAHFVQSFSYTWLLFLSFFSVVISLLAHFVRLLAAIGMHAYWLMALGVALYPLRWTRGLAITMLVFGATLFFGMPLAIGATSQAGSLDTPEERDRAAILYSLNNETYPARLLVISRDGSYMPWSYVEMSSRVEVSAPWSHSVRSFNFSFTRFYNGSDVVIPPNCVIDATLDYCINRDPTVARTLLYRSFNVSRIWYMGYWLEPGVAGYTLAGRSITEPMPELLSIRTEREYYDAIYKDAPLIKIDAPSIEGLNSNSTSIVHYLDGAYTSISRIGKGLYRFNYTLSRESYECWVSRTEEVYDPETNSTYTVYYYRSRSTYVGSSEGLLVSRLPWSGLEAEVAEVLEEPHEPSIRWLEAMPGEVVDRGLALGYEPLYLEPAVRLDGEPLTIGEDMARAAKEVPHPGMIEGELHVMDEAPAITIEPAVEVYEIYVEARAARESGEQEGSCPPLPESLDAASVVRLSSDPAPAYSPPFIYPDLEKFAGRSALHTLYEQDPKSPLLMPSEQECLYGICWVVGEVVTMSMAIALPLMAADALSMLLGGHSIGGAVFSVARSIALPMALLMGRALSRFPGLPSVKKSLSKAQRTMDKLMLKQLELERVKAMAMGDKLTLFNIHKAFSAYKRYRSPGMMARSYAASLLSPAASLARLARIKGPSRTVESLRAPVNEARNEFYKEASRLLNKDATLAQAISRLMVDRAISRDEAKQMLSKLRRSQVVSLAGMRERWGIISALVLGRGKVPEALVRGGPMPKGHRPGMRYAAEALAVAGMTLPARAAARLSMPSGVSGEVSYGAVKVVEDLEERSEVSAFAYRASIDINRPFKESRIEIDNLDQSRPDDRVLHVFDPKDLWLQLAPRIPEAEARDARIEYERQLSEYVTFDDARGELAGSLREYSSSLTSLGSEPALHKASEAEGLASYAEYLKPREVERFGEGLSKIAPTDDITLDYFVPDPKMSEVGEKISKVSEAFDKVTESAPRTSGDRKHLGDYTEWRGRDFHWEDRMGG